MTTFKEINILKIVSSRLESKRDELMDVINSSIVSDSPNRVEYIYNAQIELANIEKALEMNQYFQVQIQEQLLNNAIQLEKKEGTKESENE